MHLNTNILQMLYSIIVHMNFIAANLFIEINVVYLI